MFKIGSPTRGDIFQKVTVRAVNRSGASIAPGTVCIFDTVPDASGDRNTNTMALISGNGTPGGERLGNDAPTYTVIGQAASNAVTQPPTNQATARTYGLMGVYESPSGASLADGAEGVFVVYGYVQARVFANMGVADGWFPMCADSSGRLIKLAGSAANRRVVAYYVGRQAAAGASNPGRQTADDLSTTEGLRTVIFNGQPIFGTLVTA